MQQTLRNKKITWTYLVLLLVGVTVSSGCATTGGTVAVGPLASSNYGPTTDADADNNALKIDVVVPVFDPNLPEDSDTWEEKGIFAELRRAESNRFALKMKAALEDENAFNTVRVAPNSTATGDLYVSGKIITSNGEDVEISITVADISGKHWFTKDFEHRVKEEFHANIRNKGEDAYAPVFEEAAAYIVKQLKKRKAAELAQLKLVSEIRFGNSLSEKTFSKYLKINGARVELAAAPADDDPMLRRIKPIRVRDQLFIDRMQTYYADFDQQLNESYLMWQQQSLFESKAAREAKAKSLAQGIIGGLLAVGGIAAAIISDDVAADVVATGAAIAGAVVLGQSFQTRAEMKVHREALAELGQSIDIEIAPQVVEYENQTAELTGDAAEQHRQWIAFLKKIYDLEATPEKQL